MKKWPVQIYILRNEFKAELEKLRTENNTLRTAQTENDKLKTELLTTTQTENDKLKTEILTTTQTENGQVVKDHADRQWQVEDWVVVSYQGPDPR